MARPTKQGVDYFPFDVHLDDKFKFVEIKYKLEGFATVIKLLQRIYSLGYWCKMSGDEIILFSDEIKADFVLVENVINECINRDIFDVGLYEKYKILTSRGIQKRYFEIAKRRKVVEINKEYLLIDVSFLVNADINGVNVNINPVNADIMQTSSKHDVSKSTQSKVNKTKQNKTIKEYPEQIKNLLSRYSSIPDFNKLNKEYWNVIRTTRTTKKVSESVIFNNMSVWEKYDPVIVQYALKTHIEAHPRMKENYTIGIMRGTSKEDAEDRLNNIQVKFGTHTKQNEVKAPYYPKGDELDAGGNESDSKPLGNVKLYK